MSRSPMIPAGILLGAILSLQPGMVHAGDNPLIAEGITQYNDLMYEESVNTLSAALMRPGNTQIQLIEIYKYLGLDYLLLEKPDEAAGAFRQLLIINENWSFDTATTSPKITTFFNATKQKWIDEGKPGKITAEQPKVVISHKVPDSAAKGEPINLKITVTDPGGKVAQVVLNYRLDKEYHAVKAMPQATPGTETTYMATIPGEAVVPSSVDYFVEALDPMGNTLATRGDEDAPLRIPLPVDQGGGSVAKKWWFWTIIGVVVVGVTGGVVGGVLSKKGGGGPSTPASVTITVCESADCP